MTRLRRPVMCFRTHNSMPRIPLQSHRPFQYRHRKFSAYAFIALSLALMTTALPSAGAVGTIAEKPNARFTAPIDPSRLTIIEEQARVVSEQPSLQFSARAYHLPKTEMLIFGGSSQPDRRSVAPNHRTFAQLELLGRDAEDAAITFAIEAQSEDPPYRHCTASDVCDDVRIAVTNGQVPGLMYLSLPTSDRHAVLHLSDFPERILELSADDESGLKVYREARLEQPMANDHTCDDYPDTDRPRFACLFLRELFPSPPAVPDEDVRNALPKLTQPTSNYNLVFAEEFDSQEPAREAPYACSNNVSTLDSSFWRHLLALRGTRARAPPNTVWRHHRRRIAN